MLKYLKNIQKLLHKVCYFDILQLYCNKRSIYVEIEGDMCYGKKIRFNISTRKHMASK